MGGGKRYIKHATLPSGYLPHNPPRERNRKGKCLGACMNMDIKPASRFANEAVNPAAPAVQRVCIARYLERFAYFFSKTFFVRKCFETLNSEQKPEHVGVRAALRTLFEAYRRESFSGVACETESYVDHCYADDMYVTLDLDKTARFLAWLGVVLPPGHYTKNQDGDDCTLWATPTGA